LLGVLKQIENTEPREKKLEKKFKN
jgi:hypothetical protein